MTEIYPELALGWRDSCVNRWSWTRFKCLSTGAAACPQTPLSSYPGASWKPSGQTSETERQHHCHIVHLAWRLGE